MAGFERVAILFLKVGLTRTCTSPLTLQQSGCTSADLAMLETYGLGAFRPKERYSPESLSLHTAFAPIPKRHRTDIQKKVSKCGNRV
jgi:hypothetical protein